MCASIFSELSHCAEVMTHSHACVGEEKLACLFPLSLLVWQVSIQEGGLHRARSHTHYPMQGFLSRGVACVPELAICLRGISVLEEGVGYACTQMKHLLGKKSEDIFF